jgi:hypothetical protein
MSRDEKVSVLKRIYFWVRWESKYLPRDIAKGIRNLWYWFPVIWKDRSFSNYYILEILKHKLSDQAKFADKLEFFDKSDISKLKTCIKLIKSYQDETYVLEYVDYSEEKLYSIPSEDEPITYELHSEILWENYDELFKKYPLIYKRVLNGEGVFIAKFDDESKQKRLNAMNLCYINQQRADALLFKMLERYISHWSC